MIKIDLNKVCCFSLLFANLYSPSGLLCYFLVASPIERRSRLAIENIEKAIYEVIVPLPLPLLLRPHFIQIGPTFLCPRFLYTLRLDFYAMDFNPDILMFILYCYVLTLVPVWFCGLRNISTPTSLSAVKYRLRTTELKKTNLLLSL